MCWCLTLAVPPGRALPASERGWLHIQSCREHRFPPGWNCFSVTAGMCACGLYERPDEAMPSSGKTDDDLRATYQSKGWSPAKIERALRDRMGAQARRAQRFSEPLRLRERVVEWVGTYGQVCILAQWEGRSLDGPNTSEPGFLDMTAENFLQHSFAPETVVRIGTNREQSNGAKLDR